MEELECSQGGSTEQRVLVRERVGLMRLLLAPVRVVMGLACMHWGHQIQPSNAEKCPPSQIGSAPKLAVAHPRCNPG